MVDSGSAGPSLYVGDLDTAAAGLTLGALELDEEVAVSSDLVTSWVCWLLLGKVSSLCSCQRELDTPRN